MTRRRIFYGWYLVAGAGVTALVSVVVNSNAPSILVKPMIAEMGWSRTEFFAIQVLGTVVTGLSAPFIGSRVDRGKPRLLVLVGSLLLSGSVMMYSQVHSLWLYLLLAGIAAPLGLALCGMSVLNAIVGKWFERKRGRALIAVGVGLNIGGIFGSPVLVGILSWLGWRLTWVVLGLAVLVIMVPVALLVRRSPEDMGLQPDGETRPATGPVSSLPQEPEWRWRQLMRSGTFWQIAVIFGFSGMSMGAIALHTYPFLTDRNIAAAVAAVMVSTISLTGLITRPLWGYMLERWNLRYAAMVAMLLVGLAIGGLPFATSVTALFVLMVVRGIPMGGMAALPTMFWGHYFGRRSLGKVLGLAHLVALPFSVVGPLLAAWTFDALQSYTIVFLMYAVLCFTSGAMVFLVRSRPADKAADARRTVSA